MVRGTRDCALLMGFDRVDLVDPAEEEGIATGGAYMDNLKGVALEPALTRRARPEEIKVFRERIVYEVVPRSAMKAWSQLIGVRWAETDKGQPGKPKVRSCLVGQVV